MWPFSTGLYSVILSHGVLKPEDTLEIIQLSDLFQLHQRTEAQRGAARGIPLTLRLGLDFTTYVQISSLVLSLQQCSSSLFLAGLVSVKNNLYTVRNRHSLGRTIVSFLLKKRKKMVSKKTHQRHHLMPPQKRYTLKFIVTDENYYKILMGKNYLFEL